MKKITILLIVLFLGIFFFLHIIPSNILPQTEEEKMFCQTHGCGSIVLTTPFEFIINIIIYKIS